MSLQALLGESRTDRIKGCAFYRKYNILNVIWHLISYQLRVLNTKCDPSRRLAIRWPSSIKDELRVSLDRVLIRTLSILECSLSAAVKF